MKNRWIWGICAHSSVLWCCGVVVLKLGAMCWLWRWSGLWWVKCPSLTLLPRLILSTLWWVAAVLTTGCTGMCEWAAYLLLQIFWPGKPGFGWVGLILALIHFSELPGGFVAAAYDVVQRPFQFEFETDATIDYFEIPMMIWVGHFPTILRVIIPQTKLVFFFFVLYLFTGKKVEDQKEFEVEEDED